MSVAGVVVVLIVTMIFATFAYALSLCADMYR